MRSIRDLNLEGRAVFLRLDLNVPIKNGTITSDARIQAAMPTIRHAIDAGARVALASHLGRPKGKRVPEMSLEPVGSRLSEILGKDVVFSEDCIGDGVKRLMQDLRPGGVLLLENLRYHDGEKKNDAQFAKLLAAPFDAYVNDAFGSCHRADASIVGILDYIEDSAAGFLLDKEVAAISKLLQQPKRPFVAVVGGAKVADKVGVMSSLLDKVDAILVGGAMAYTFLKAKGVEIGKSRCEGDKVYVAKDILDRAASRKVDILLPTDHVVAADFAEDAPAQIITTVAIPQDQMGLDIGPMTRKVFAERLAGAKTVFWNGPMGVFEWASFAAGTMAIAEAMAGCSGYTVVGGGDSVAALEKAGCEGKISHVSTGGGASLELVEKGTLPGIDVLK
ncbi:MAG: phosphoglycerate kinase [Deltaproteobacteria bacterium RIFOXYA12_FULL_58_15]|nr:MAG: phosphoglycerate kinase [Deltaproteobacteria bacterium RIFOXYA12_FULL_58_15]OGR08623.1 MAG: phosphoglycerate kinase [Deltaproteobacteria bacterium RIFOXYB12_FULL_58_9]